MKIQMYRSLGGLRPMNSEDEEILRSLPKDWQGEVTLKHPRNYEFHKKYFALIKLGFENQERYKNKDHYRKVMQMKAGYYDTIETDKGTVWLPLSISFGSMEADEFTDLYSKVLYEISLDLGLSFKDLDTEVQAELNGFH